MSRSEFKDVELSSLVGIYYADECELGEFNERPPDAIPVNFQKLLAHNHHMTVTVEEHLGESVSVQVCRHQKIDQSYEREILLRRQSDYHVVQYGIVRLHFNFLDADVQREIERQSKPLGRILIEHNVLRTVRLLSLFEIKPGPVLKRMFHLRDPLLCYGRTAIIYCNESPVVELLEILPHYMGQNMRKNRR